MFAKGLVRWYLVAWSLPLWVHFTLIHTLPAIAQATDPSQQPSPPPSTESQTATKAEKTDFCPQPYKYEPSPRSIPLDSPVGKIQVRGYTVLTEAEITEAVKKAIESLQGSPLTKEGLGKKVIDQITLLYISKGYITSRVAFETPPINQDGLIQLIAVEGYVSTIEVQGRQRLSLAYICSRIRQGITPPLKKDRLEEQLRLLKTDPFFNNVEANLKAGKLLGESILALQVSESRAFNGSLGADNFSPPSIGSERLGIALSYRNLVGIGDAISASYYVSTTGGSKAFDANYRVPLNPMNGTIQLRVAPSRSKITDSFKALGIRADNNLYEITYRQPFIRSVREEFAVSLGFSLENGQTFLLNEFPYRFGIGPDANGNSRTRVLRFGQDYVKRDPNGAWGLRSQFSFGLNIFNATSNPSPIPDGSFFSWLGQVQRIQRINEDNLLIAQADVQLTPDSLLPSQQYILGGGQSVRGYRQNARSADNGFRFSLEDRIAIQRDKNGLPILQLAPFFDMGSAWNKSSNPNKLGDQNFLAGIGLGIIFEPMSGIVIRLDYARPLIDIRDRGNNAQDKGFYFSIGITP